MAKFDRYLLSQLLVLFGFFALVLVLIYWINRAVVLFDQLIANGESAVVFLEFTALSLPNVIRLALPIAAIAATIYATNRLASESELVVMQSTGFSPARLARPVLAFGVVVSLLLSALVHVLVPTSAALLSERQAEIAENITSRLLREGQFLHPAAGITFYLRELTPQGEMKDVFLSDRRAAETATAYSAKRALVVPSDTGPKLVMFDGAAQTLNLKTRRLSVTEFEDFAYDIGALIQSSGQLRLNPREVSTLDLLFPSKELQKETRLSASELAGYAHDRFNQAAITLVGPVLAFSVMLLGSFSRFGMWRQILGAIVTLILLKSADNALGSLAARDPALWPLTYAAALAGLAMTGVLLWVSARPSLFARRRQEVPA